jgi:hypothetical protein
LNIPPIVIYRADPETGKIFDPEVLNNIKYNITNLDRKNYENQFKLIKKRNSKKHQEETLE